MIEVVFRSRVAAPAREVFAWHERPGALARLTPPWETTTVVRHDGIRDGDLAELRVGVGPFAQRWLARHRDYVEGVQFTDEQLEGPFARWRHTHRFEPRNGSACVVEDRVEYELPLGALGRAFGARFVARKLERMFAWRHATLAGDLERHLSAPRGARVIAVSGASGLIGRQLCAFLATGGHQVLRLVRRTPRSADEIAWDPRAGTIDGAMLEGIDAVVHLAGAGIAEQRWTPARKRELRDSRVDGTRLLARALASLQRPPEVFVSASAIGFYGDRDGVVDASAPRGEGFLAELCADWEAAADPARNAGIRVVHPRIGIVLTPAGGALAKMLPAFKAGVGATLGDGRAPLSWVDLDDVLGALHFAIFHRGLEGAFDLTAPEPTTQAGLARALADALHRPAALRIPAPLLRAGVGELAESLLGGAAVVPTHLGAAGFRFHHPTLSSSLAHQLGVGSPREALEVDVRRGAARRVQQ